MHRNLERQVHESRQIGSGQSGDGKSERRQVGISKLKWTGMGEFNSDDHIAVTLGKNIIEEKEQPI